MSASGPQRGLGSVFTNWRTYDASFSTKLRMALRNSWKKARNRSGCCGNTGEPGC